MIHIARSRNQIHTTVQPGAGDGKLGELSGYSHLSRPQMEQPCRCYSGCRRRQKSPNNLPKLRPVLTKTMYAQKTSMRQQYGTRTPSQTSERSRWQRDKVPNGSLGDFTTGQVWLTCSPSWTDANSICDEQTKSTWSHKTDETETDANVVYHYLSNTHWCLWCRGSK